MAEMCLVLPDLKIEIMIVTQWNKNSISSSLCTICFINKNAHIIISDDHK
jgi:hypothetical protein